MVKIVKIPGNGRLNNLNDPALIVLMLIIDVLDENINTLFNEYFRQVLWRK